MRGRTVLSGVVTGLLVAGLGVGPATSAAAAESADKNLRTSECQGDWLPATPTSEEIMAGRLSFVDLPPVKIGKDIDWRLNPYRNRSWGMVFHSLRWMGRLVADYETTGKKEFLNRAVEIAKDWVKDNPRGRGAQYSWEEHPIALRAPALVCLSKHVKGAWLTRSLAEHATMLSNPALYEKGHNHGIDQDIALLGIGCRYRKAKWTNLAIKRLTETVRIDVDSQGALREQAPRYGVYVHQRLKVAMDNIKDCGRKVPATIVKRWKLLESYIAHATQPNGYMVPIGDGSADVRPGGEYRHDKKTVKVFRNGYVFGRTAWDKESAAYYSIRFGAGMRFHGHEDHLGVTYYARGRDILVDTGFHSYENTAYRYWTMSPEAHNVPVVQGQRFRPRTASRLTKSAIKKGREVFTLTDKAYGVPRTRTVLVNHDADVMAVLDRAGSGTLRNLWHLAADLQVTANAGGTVVARDKDFKVSLVQLAMPACKPISGQSVRIGQTTPYQGWLSPTYMSKVKAPAVISPAAPALLTVVVPGTDDPDVSCSGGRVTVHTPEGKVTFKASASALS